MKSNNKQSDTPPKPKFMKGFRSRSRSVEEHNDRTTADGPPTSLSASSEFSPEPTIEAQNIGNKSDPTTPTKKNWELNYRAFLTKKKSPSSKSSDDSATAATDAPKSPTSRKAGFSIIPGPKRLVSRPSSAPKSPRLVSQRHSLPNHVAALGPPARRPVGSRAESMPSLKQPPLPDEKEGGSIRGGKIFHSMFARSSSASAGMSSRNRVKSLDELDDTLRGGVEKSYSPHTKNPNPGHSAHYISPPPTTIPSFPATRTQVMMEKDDAGLDSLLASADSATNMSEMMPSHLRSNSLSSHQLYNVTEGSVQEPPESLSHPFYQAQYPSQQGNMGNLGLDLENSHIEVAHTTAHQNSSMLKKAFTQFHNSSKFHPDSVSPFLGDDPSTTLRHDSYAAYSNNWMYGVAGSSVPQYALSGQSPYQPISTSLPLETVDEGNISIHKGMRLLKPIAGTSEWQQGRRYLISPAALVQCPLSVVSKLSGGKIMNSSTAATLRKGVGVVDLGEVLITYVGEKHHLSMGKWSNCRLVLRQNILLEYDLNTPPMSGLPRGFAHLQYAIAYAHADFVDALQLQFFASPCAQADQRVLMIRAANREERDNLVTCLNDAAKLRIEDIWNYDAHHEFGRGRYAVVFPARRRSSEETDGERGPGHSPYDCALKIIDKNQFWRRVVKGRERADTLVREVAVQSTLSAKCENVPSFLKIRGFFETSDNIVLELEMLKGSDLFEFISQKGVVAEAEAASITADILKSLEAMNRIGVAHRDIKPANILMCDESRDGVKAKLADFGMSTFTGVDGLVRGRCGTPGYVAPEILASDAKNGYGNKIDIFSTGVTLYVMLCGYEPFYGESEEQLIEANKCSVLEFPDDDWATVSHEAKDFLRKMTAKDPSARLSATEALAHPWIEYHSRSRSKENGTLQQNLSNHTSEEGGVCTIS